MSLEALGNVLLWCTALNYGVVTVWFLAFKLAHDWMYRVHGGWFRLSVEQFDAIHYAGMMVYKLGVLLFCLVPYIALRMVG